MAFSTEQRKQLIVPTAAYRREVIKAATDYMARAGLNETDFARRIRTPGGSNYARSTLNLFLNGRYHKVSGDDSAICAAVTDFIAAHPISPLVDTAGKMYETENTRLVRKYFYDALDFGRAYFFKGPPGTQKSFVLQKLVAELNRVEIAKNGHGRRAFYVYCSQGIRPAQLMKEVATAAGSLAMGDTRRVFRNLRFDVGSRKSLFVFDEAQHLDVHCLETVRELHDMPPHSGLLFAGSHEIESTFNRLDMEQWHSRLRHGAELPGIQEGEAQEIIAGELPELPADKVQKLIKGCYAMDLRKGRQVKYISARNLFYAIQAIQERRKGTAQ
jgi:DNA transposition AAA+ family ATPase